MDGQSASLGRILVSMCLCSRAPEGSAGMRRRSLERSLQEGRGERGGGLLRGSEGRAFASSPVPVPGAGGEASALACAPGGPRDCGTATQGSSSSGYHQSLAADRHHSLLPLMPRLASSPPPPLLLVPSLHSKPKECSPSSECERE